MSGGWRNQSQPYKGYSKGSGKGNGGKSDGPPAWVFAQLNEMRAMTDSFMRKEEEAAAQEKEKSMMKRIQSQTAETVMNVLGLNNT